MNIEAIFTWSIKVSLLLIVIYGTYRFLFRRSTRFVLKRTLLLLSLLLSIAIPFIKIEVPITPIYSTQEVQETPINIPSIEKQSSITITPASAASVKPKTTFLSWKSILGYIYVAGLIISLFILLLEFVKLSIWYFFGVRRKDIQNNIITHRSIKYPFSFWKWIFIPAGTTYTSEIWQIIEKHESAHLKQGHSIDMLITSFVQCLIWYNPVIYLIQKDTRENHEALADELVLKFINFKKYANALISISLEYPSLKLGHSFAQTSSISKRLEDMKKQKTTFGRTLIMTITFVLITSTITAFNVLKAQDFRNETREEVRERIKKDLNFSTNVALTGKLSNEHEKVLYKLSTIHPDKDIRFFYMDESNPGQYFGFSGNQSSPLYFGKVNHEQRLELLTLLKTDSSRLNSIRFSRPDSKEAFSLYDFIDEMEESIHNTCNYIMFYEPNYDVDVTIYDIDEVDVKPEPIGGVEAFTRSIALDTKLPEAIRKRDLPETIDYEVVVNGGRILANVNLLTELKGSDKKNKELYLFFGQILKQIQDKSRQFYLWKSGIKDGKEVRVRTRISIPTKYM